VIDIPLTICFTMMLISGFAWVFHKETICEWVFEDFENSYHASLGSAIIIGWGLSFFVAFIHEPNGQYLSLDPVSDFIRERLAYSALALIIGLSIGMWIKLVRR